MTDLNVLRAVWSTPKGGSGVSTFYARDSVTAPLAKVRSFFESLKSAIPNNVTISYPTSGPFISDVDGATKGVWSETGNAVTTGTGTAGYAGSAGACIIWHTGVYAGRREIKGKTFIVPLIGGMWDADGTMLPGCLTILNTAAALLTTGLQSLSVYSPTNHTSATMASSTVTDRMMVLKSRAK